MFFFYKKTVFVYTYSNLFSTNSSLRLFSIHFISETSELCLNAITLIKTYQKSLWIFLACHANS